MTQFVKYLRLIFLSLLGLYFSLSFWFIIKPGEIGIVLNLGKIARTEENGIHVKWPIVESVKRMNVRISKDIVKSEAASKDLQRIDTAIAVNYGLRREQVEKIFINFETRKNLEDRIVEPAVQETMKAITAKFTAEELITHRHIVSNQIKEDLIFRLSPFGLQIEGISIINFEFSKEFSDSVEQKNVAVQKALMAQRDLERIKIEAEQKIASARAEAESLRIQKSEVTPAMVNLRAIEKWDGHLPQMMGAAPVFFEIMDKKNK